MNYSLLILNGSSLGATLQLDLSNSPLTIGRDEVRELRLEDNRVSRLHAQVINRDGQWLIEDCGSLNGTFVNSQPIRSAVLEPGDLIRIGERLILLVDDSQHQDDLQVRSEGRRSDTLAGRPTDHDNREAMVEQSLGHSVSRVVRDSAVLCRLANQLHQRNSTDRLVQVAIDALADGIGAGSVTVWLVGTDGRLKCAGRGGALDDPADETHVLASLAVEQNEPIFDAVLAIDESAPPDQTMRTTQTDLSRRIAVPIPAGTGCRGAIQCQQPATREYFDRGDLDFCVVVAHHTGLALENLEHRERLEQANQSLRSRLAAQTQLVGNSDVMRGVLDQVAKVGPTAATVLILGDSGTGKELVAQSIHELSPRKDGPYVAVNCAAFSDSILESELFGHEPGAFTGADRRYIGHFERAHRGTIFLDEVGEMSQSCQAKLLRLLEGHPFQRVGGSEPIHVDLRVVAATHRDLENWIRDGRFRKDLYYRLRVIDINIPPLRARGEDAMEIATQFVEHFRQQLGRGPGRLSLDATEAIRHHDWPGNVRELKNAVERAVVLGRGEEITASDLGLASLSRQEQATPAAAAAALSLKEAERRHIEFVLDRVGGNKTEACKVLKIGRSTLYEKLAE